MNLNEITPRKALNKAYLKLSPHRSEIDNFKKNLKIMIDRIDRSETEEFHKNIVKEFLQSTYYRPHHYINTKGRTDLVIHSSSDAGSSVCVLIETKSPANRYGMLRKDNLNVKALQELLFYYLNERITGRNIDIKYLIATNIYEWFIFDAKDFERYFAQNNRLVKKYQDFMGGRLSGNTTDFFYNEIAKPYITNIENVIPFVWFDIREYQTLLQSENKENDKKLIVLYKILSPEHLLKLPFANDSNTLDETFYAELLHIIGLSEIKRGNKKVIERKKSPERCSGTLIENTILQLESREKIARLADAEQFGETYEESLFNVALELVITWINRILFLKLLEAQLINYHRSDRSYAFLNPDKIKNFDDLDCLFFRVLARRKEERDAEVAPLFDNIPYLNSSLFEPTELEHSTIFISNLQDDRRLPLMSSTVLKDAKGKKRKGKLNTLEYLFNFLDAYDFCSEKGEDIQEERKNLISASVLGLIFEKINGYRDGSYFTPGFITMFMCREAIRKAVVEKFNEVKGWRCRNLDEVYNNLKREDTTEANRIVNSLKICDPAVGSGHFLVSALNEIIAIKNDLQILVDRQGHNLRFYQVEVVNDELTITDEDGLLFEYNPKSSESQRIQEALFHEKKTIIENCLFGVDINPKSVKICQLRLWIELLKNAYYKYSSSPAKGRCHEVTEGLEIPAKGRSSYRYTGKVMNRPEFKTFRKKLRRSLTPAEATLWKML